MEVKKLKTLRPYFIADGLFEFLGDVFDFRLFGLHPGTKLLDLEASFCVNGLGLGIVFLSGTYLSALHNQFVEEVRAVVGKERLGLLKINVLD